MFTAQNPNTQDAFPVDACIELNECGQVAYDEWLQLPIRFPHCKLGVFQIMPDHMHGIIILSPVGASLADAHPSENADAHPSENADAHLSENADAHPSENADAINNADANNDADADAVGASAKGASANAAKGASARDARTAAGDIVGAYKSLVFNGCLEIYKARDERMGKLWHRNYHENIIRKEESFQRITNYIINNPSKWLKKKNS